MQILLDTRIGCRFKVEMGNDASPAELTIAMLVALVRSQAAEIVTFKARIADLERRLGLDSTNSSKPPSSDGLKRKTKPARVSSLREKSTRPSGGQRGHKGEALRQSATPDHVIDHFPPACGDCGAALTVAMSEDHSARQVFDLPKPPPLEIVEHRAHLCRCAGCGNRTRAPFPKGVNAPVQYGVRIAAFVIYLLHYQLLPEGRLVKLMADLFDVRLTKGTVANMSRVCAGRLGDFVKMVRASVAIAPVKHMDETGFRIGVKTQWLHVASTALLTFYRTCTRRGSLLLEVSGVIVHDHWKPYYTMPNVSHALCNAHHLRELQALIDIEGEDWARRMRTLLRRACHAANLARERDKPLKPELIAMFELRYDAILAAGLTFHEAQPPLSRAPTKTGRKPRGQIPRRTGHNLIARLIARRQDTLRFLHDPAVPFTNNLAESDIRMMKLRQKISGGFRSEHGAQTFATIRSTLSTARKQGWDILSAISSDSPELSAKLRLA